MVAAAFFLSYINKLNHNLNTFSNVDLFMTTSN